MQTRFSSGDMLADRRFRYGEEAAREGDHGAAADLFAQALEIAPLWAGAWFALGEAREKAGDRAGAGEAFRRVLMLAPSDPFGAQARLSLLGEDTLPDRLPDDYVRQLFDDYAPRFDAHLTQVLAYRGPQLLAERVRHIAPGRRFSHAADLGCGTGLSGLAFRDICDLMSGCDLSPAMIAQARAKNIYDHLEAAPLAAFVEGLSSSPADLIIAADVLVYLGALDAPVQAVARALTPGGLFAFTVQSVEGAGYRLMDDMRFGYSAAYLENVCTGAGLSVLLCDAASARLDGGRPVPGLAVIAARS